jgi:hypothetical protein
MQSTTLQSLYIKVHEETTKKHLATSTPTCSAMAAAGEREKKKEALES